MATEIITASVSIGTKAKVLEMAKKEKRSLSNMVDFLLNKAMDSETNFNLEKTSAIREAFSSMPVPIICLEDIKDLGATKSKGDYDIQYIFYLVDYINKIEQGLVPTSEMLSKCKSLIKYIEYIEYCDGSFINPLRDDIAKIKAECKAKIETLTKNKQNG